jgi:hypothetical protein
MERKLVLLLGSGVSRAAGMPSVSKITESVVSGVLDGRAYKSMTDESYTNSSAIDFVPGRMQSVLGFIREIQRRCSRYFRREVNYEDIAYVAWQIRDQQSENYENPALVPLIILLRRKFPGKERLVSIARQACAYIHCVVRDMLSKPPSGLGHMPCLVEASLADDFDRIDVFTLNHDTLIEQELRAQSADFTDGFEQRTETCNYWVAQGFAEARNKVRVAKLHGSVDWYAFRPDPSNPMREMIGKPKPWDEGQRPVDDQCVMLIGSFNKILEYTGGIFSDLFCAFRGSLRCTTHLVVGGYGFGDKAVNHSTIEWLRGSTDRRLIIIHKDIEKLGKGARLAIQDLFSRNASQIAGTGTWFQETSLACVRSRF